MAEYSDIFFNIAAFIGGLFVLEYGADTFIDHTAKVASRLGVSPTLIALLTAGAEWEELAVVIAAIGQSRDSLALGNILGSSISNILGAFSLGLMFSPTDMGFDRSAKIYTSLLLGLTTAVVIFLTFFQGLGRIGGALLVTTFILYVTSIAYFIYKGVVPPPQADDSDSDSDSESEESSESTSNGDNQERGPRHTITSTLRSEDVVQYGTVSSVDPERGRQAEPNTENGGNVKPAVHRQPRSLLYHIALLFLGFLALSLSGYILSHSISSLADSLSLSSSLLGITILSFATTLPEKFVAIVGGARREGGIVVANVAGSNIFLLTLCTGILFLAGDGRLLREETGVTVFEMLSVWGSSLLLWGIVMVGGKRWMGWVLMGLYVVFLVAEFLFFRR